MGFDIEDQQYVVMQINSYHGLMSHRFIFKHELSRTKGKKTSKQLADLKEKRSALIRQIIIWRPIQLAYTPHVAALLPLVQGDVADTGGHYSNPESTPLFFPSSLPPNLRQRPELNDICEAERRLHKAQADDAWLMFAAYVALSKVCGSSRSSMFQEQETGRTRGCLTPIADLSPNYNERLTVTVSHIQPYWLSIQMGPGKSGCRC